MNVNDIKARLESVRQKTLTNRDSADCLVKALDQCVEDLYRTVSGSSSGENAVSQLSEAVNKMKTIRNNLEEASDGMSSYIDRLSS